MRGQLTFADGTDGGITRGILLAATMAWLWWLLHALGRALVWPGLHGRIAQDLLAAIRLLHHGGRRLIRRWPH
jgi:hypothetical protein